MKYTLSKFEVAMMQIFHQLCGSDTRSVKEQVWWKDIQDLKKAAQDELQVTELNQGGLDANNKTS